MTIKQDLETLEELESSCSKDVADSIRRIIAYVKLLEKKNFKNQKFRESLNQELRKKYHDC